MTRSFANRLANGVASTSSADDVEMRDVTRNGTNGGGGGGAAYRGINRYLQDVLQATVGNLPELVYRISRERNTTNEQALRFLQDEITRLVSRASAEVGAPLPPGSASDAEIARLRAVIEKDRETIEALEAEVSVVKRIFAKNRQGTCAEDRRRVAELQAKVCQLQQELRRERRKASRAAVLATEAAASSSANRVAEAVNEARRSAQPETTAQPGPQSSTSTSSSERYYDEARAARLADELQRTQAELNRARETYERRYAELRNDCDRERRETNELRSLLAEQRRRESDEHRRLREIVLAVYPDAPLGASDDAEQFDRIVSRLSALLAEYQSSTDSYAELAQIRDSLQRRVDALVGDVERLTRNDTRFAQMIALIRDSERELVAAIRYRDEVTNERLIRLGHVRQRILEQEMILRQLNMQDVEDPASDRLPPGLSNVVALRNTLRQECRQLLAALGIPDNGQCTGAGLLDYVDVTLRAPSRASTRLGSRAGTAMSAASTSSSTITAPSIAAGGSEAGEAMQTERSTTPPPRTPIRLGSALSVLPPNLLIDVRGPVDQEAQRNVENAARVLNDARLRMTRIRTPETNLQVMLNELNMYVAEQQQLDNAMRRAASVRSLALPYEPAVSPQATTLPSLPPEVQQPQPTEQQEPQQSSSPQTTTTSAVGTVITEQNDPRPRLTAESPFVPIRATPSIDHPPDARVVELLSNVRSGGGRSTTSTTVSVPPGLPTIAEQRTPTPPQQQSAVEGTSSRQQNNGSSLLPDLMRFEDIVAHAAPSSGDGNGGDLLNLDPYADFRPSTAQSVRTPRSSVPPTPGATLFPNLSGSNEDEYGRETAAAVQALQQSIASPAESSRTETESQEARANVVASTEDTRPAAPGAIRTRGRGRTQRRVEASPQGGVTETVETDNEASDVGGRITRSMSRSRSMSVTDTEQPARSQRDRSRSRSPIMNRTVFVPEEDIPSVPTPQSIAGSELYEFDYGTGDGNQSSDENDEAVVVPTFTF